MAVTFNHTIVHSVDKHVSAQWFSRIMGLAEPFDFSVFRAVELSEGVTFDFCDADKAVDSQHYAFLVSDQEFDEIYGRIQAEGIEHWADPARNEGGAINHHFGGRGVYFCDPSGHFLEIITAPYER